VSVLDYYAEHGPEQLADEGVGVPGMKCAVTRREPMGVTLGIKPWNGPVLEAVRVAVPNLMPGNTVILEPSEVTAGSTLLLDDLFRATGFPESVGRPPGERSPRKQHHRPRTGHRPLGTPPVHRPRSPTATCHRHFRGSTG
jgi:hypothetical protein